MPYLSCLLNNQLRAKKSDESLCYYTNSTKVIQTIRATSEEVCYLECLLFPGEKVLVPTLFNSYIEISSPDIHEQIPIKIECNLLYV